MGVEVYGVSTDTHFTHKAWHDTSDTIKKIKYPMIGDPTGTITRNFDVMIEEEGLACAAPSSSTPRARSRSSRSTPAASAVTPRNCCARSRPPSTWPATRAKSAPPSGRKAPPRWRRRWIWSARSEPPPPPRPRAFPSVPGPGLQLQGRAPMPSSALPVPIPTKEKTMLDANIKTQLKAYLESSSSPSNWSPRSTAAPRAEMRELLPTSPSCRPRCRAHRWHRRPQAVVLRRPPRRAGARPLRRHPDGPRVHLAGAGPAADWRPSAQGRCRGDRTDQGFVWKLRFETYISLSCHNCPDVVQALNLMAVLNPASTSVMIDGACTRTK
jgi:hypothetical protein